jgi:hypothetical protein
LMVPVVRIVAAIIFAQVGFNLNSNITVFVSN